MKLKVIVDANPNERILSCAATMTFIVLRLSSLEVNLFRGVM